jgi:hypothetical protein
VGGGVILHLENGPLNPIQGFDSKIDCERAAVAVYKNTKYGKQIDGTEIIQTLHYGAIYRDPSGKTTMVMEHRCLTETIDPRSRK